MKRKYNIKNDLRHLNNCYQIFEKEAISRGMTDKNKDEYIKILLKSYIHSDYILETPELKENNE